MNENLLYIAPHSFAVAPYESSHTAVHPRQVDSDLAPAKKIKIQQRSRIKRGVVFV